MRRIVIVFAAVAMVWSLGLVWAGAPETPSKILLPKRQPSVFNAHSLCDAASKSDCAVCHPKAASSRWASERLVPNMERCADCHQAAKDVMIGTPVTADCRKCHSKLKNGERPIRGDYPRPNIRFSHAAHRGEVGCEVCHTRAASRLPDSSLQDMPTMRRCYDCHKQSKRATDCRTCHLVQQDGRVVTDYNGLKLMPPVWLKGPTHGIEWVSSHARKAGADSSFCGSCHRESFCRDCHTGKRRPRNAHPGDWLTSHGVSTRLDNPRCRGCHRKQSFCISCHRRAGVAPDSPPKSRTTGGHGRYHKTMENSQLMRRAKHDITSCVSCHSESSCISCHQTRNPHPAGFSRKCKPLATRNRRACAKCHPGEVWKRCK